MFAHFAPRLEAMASRLEAMASLAIRRKKKGTGAGFMFTSKTWSLSMESLWVLDTTAEPSNGRSNGEFLWSFAIFAMSSAAGLKKCRV